jgi:hypothetical protein
MRADKVSINAIDVELVCQLTVLKHCRVIISHGRGSLHWKATTTIEAMLQMTMKAPNADTNKRCVRCIATTV